MSANINALRAEYKQKKPLYGKFCREMETQLLELLRLNGIALAFPVESRVKSWESISKKCERESIIPATLGEIGDIAGLRIILLFRRDQEKVCETIRQFFEVLEVEDTANRLLADQFGYGSIHFQVRPKAEWLVVPTLSELQGLRAEIQVRTASQHIWAEASHALQYKRESHVPMPLRRTINRVAAILETVDLEFERVLSERGTYVEQLGTFDKDEPLNTDILEKVLSAELPPENKDVDEQFGELLDDLIAFNIDDAMSLRALLKKHHDSIFADEAERVKAASAKKAQITSPDAHERADKGVFYTHAGLVRGALRQEFGEKFNNYLREKATKAKQKP